MGAKNIDFSLILQVQRDVEHRNVAKTTGLQPFQNQTAGNFLLVPGSAYHGRTCTMLRLLPLTVPFATSTHFYV